MSRITDPMQGMESFQEALLRGGLKLSEGELDGTLYAHLDEPTEGISRITYVRLKGRTVTAFVSFVKVEPIKGRPCFQIGYAVPLAYRKQGRAKAIIKSAIAEMQNGFSRTPIGEFYIEAVVGVDNKASQCVAEQTISTMSISSRDNESGAPVLQYIRKIEAIS